ncbi:pyrroloquinoline-quinone synthase PqqC [Breoghania sp.]|uniref:pyrroloquinoline-quinone synthase PqqC n=1 Tax=Breoghania sp. TaxID=2065378 RepID=UPI002634FDE1|nr:pyrroloquinoline-quinone synthase PqqC [Breoghania sp.]MDJ0930439.1 pyrroloquinoline-quinone synthase PqqC [Breoghania sp.]
MSALAETLSDVLPETNSSNYNPGPAAKFLPMGSGDRLLTNEELEAALRSVGAARYHILHPFHQRMNAGELTRAQMQAWALNRYCYQAVIPRKDALILAQSDDPAFHREWRKHIVDHDGDDAGSEGAIRRWIKLAEGVSFDPEMVISTRYALPATRYAVVSYIDLVTKHSLLVAVASSLTEMFSEAAIAQRVPAMLARYDYITEETLTYFTPRLTQAPRDADFALAYVCTNADTPQKQADAVNALIAKCDMLWAMLDALEYAYVDPANTPPGAFCPEDLQAMRRARIMITPASRPYLPDHIQLRFDALYGRSILLAPEKDALAG